MALRAEGGRRRFLVFALFLCFASAIPVIAGPKVCGASNDAAANLIFILDASGSMGGKVEGRMKMDIAKEVLTGIIQDLPAGVDVGLTVYGHRQKGDCDDVEELAPPAPLDKKSLIEKIKSINHLGKTPITLSVRLTAEKLKSTEEEATIVLVSDGEETCEGDPCALVKELKASGVKFVAHVIGFDVGDKEKAQLSCIAEAGGGSYFSAKNAGELTGAVKKVVENTEKSAATLTLKATRNKEPLRAYYSVHTSEGDREKEKVAEGAVEVEGSSLKLAPGVYDIKVQNEDDENRPSVTFSAITIEAGKTVEKTADFTGGELQLKALRNGRPFRAFFSVYKAGDEEKQKVTEGAVEIEGSSVKLTPGVYDVEIFDEDDVGSPSVTFSALQIEPGKTLGKTADFSGGTLQLKALRNGRPFRAFCAIFKAGGEEENKVLDGAVEVEGSAFKLPPGVYDVVVTNEDDAGSPGVRISAIAIEAGKAVERTAEFEGGTLNLKARKNGKPLQVFCRIYKASGDGEEKQVVTEDQIERDGSAFKLAPGVYDIEALNEDTGERKELKGVTVEAGKSSAREIEF